MPKETIPTFSELLGARLSETEELYDKIFGSKSWKFSTYSNPDGTYHVLAIDDNGGFAVCDNIPQKEIADLITHLLNQFTPQ